MKLWLLRAKDELESDAYNGTSRPYIKSNPFHPWYDKAFGMIVRAETEQDARNIAADIGVADRDEFEDVWLNPDYTDCAELIADGTPEIIMVDMRDA